MSGARSGAIAVAFFALLVLAFGVVQFRQSSVPAGATVVAGQVVDLEPKQGVGRIGTEYWPIVEFTDPNTGEPRTVVSRNDWLRDAAAVQDAREQGRTVAVTDDGRATVVTDHGARPLLLFAASAVMVVAASVLAFKD